MASVVVQAALVALLLPMVRTQAPPLHDQLQPQAHLSPAQSSCVFCVPLVKLSALG